MGDEEEVPEWRMVWKEEGEGKRALSGERRWMSDVRCSMSDVRCWAAIVRRAMKVIFAYA